MLITTTLDKNAKLTPEQIEMLDEMNKRPIEPDEDCPAYSYEQLMEMKRRADERLTFTIRLNPAAAHKANALGAGCNGVLARLIENGLNDPELLKKAL